MAANRGKKNGAREPRMGVDVGRVIIAGDGPDTSFIGGSDDDATRAPEVVGAFEALTRLADLTPGPGDRYMEVVKRQQPRDLLLDDLAMLRLSALGQPRIPNRYNDAAVASSGTDTASCGAPPPGAWNAEFLSSHRCRDSLSSRHDALQQAREQRGVEAEGELAAEDVPVLRGDGGRVA